MAAPPRSYTTIHVARRLGVSLQTVQRWVDGGHLRAWKTPGGHRRIEAASAEEMFRSQAESLGSEPGSAAPADAVAQGPTVVIVDDSAGARDLLEAMVLQVLPQARVTTAANGFEGLIAIGRLSPDVVIADIQMPHMNGIELLRTLVADPAMRPRVLIAVTALGPSELAELGTLPAGVELLAKPLEKKALSALLRPGPT